jgi:hypothetical protein
MSDLIVDSSTDAILGLIAGHVWLPDRVCRVALLAGGGGTMGWSASAVSRLLRPVSRTAHDTSAGVAPVPAARSVRILDALSRDGPAGRAYDGISVIAGIAALA